jgi:hypothetical protein
MYTILVGKPAGKRAFWRPRRGWEENIKIDLKCGDGVIGFIWLRIGISGALL